MEGSYTRCLVFLLYIIVLFFVVVVLVRVLLLLWLAIEPTTENTLPYTFCLEVCERTNRCVICQVQSVVFLLRYVYLYLQRIGRSALVVAL